MVGGFAVSPPNAVLVEAVRREREAGGGRRVLDLGCGAARNAAPLAALGATVVGTDSSWPMLVAARRRATAEGVGDRVRVLRAPMHALPFSDAGFDVVVAHGIWNLARSGDELRRALLEGARVARRGALLFVFTFSRATLPADAEPVAGERFVFTQFAGEPQVFLTEGELLDELARAGFAKEPPGALTEYNRPAPGALSRGGPVIWEGTFRRG